MGERSGVHDGSVAEHFDEFDKRDRALALARDRGVPIERCCAVGDSRSDIPLFRALPSALALNASPAARAAASDAMDADDPLEHRPLARPLAPGTRLIDPLRGGCGMIGPCLL
ncbi:hypothetical protein Q9Q99_20090 [Curtobacterium flaccumfaciens]|nr:hypothetical protein Q9Q99_20090 [Curtobacterium flaccumfaciens]